MEVILQFIRSFNPAEAGFLYMWIILAGGVLGFLLAIERGIFLLRKSSFRPETFMKEVFSNIQQGNVAQAIKVCEHSKHMVLPCIIKAGLEEADNGMEKIQNALDEQTLTQIPKVEANLGYLGTIANVSTLLGLMGTIYGLIVAFAAVGKPGIEAAKKSELLAQGISAAMNTTLLGLGIAIPLMLVYSIYTTKTQKISDEVEEFGIRLLNTLAQRSYKTHKYHIKASHITEGVGLHITNRNVKIFADNKLIKEINL